MSDFKKGDIVVSLQPSSTGSSLAELIKPGDIRKIVGIASNDNIWFKADGRGYYDYRHFRHATEIEKEFFLDSKHHTHIEYWVRKWPSGTLTMGCKLQDLGDITLFHSLETYNNEGGVQKGHTYGKLTEGFYPQSLASQEQIDYFFKYETLTTYSSDKASTASEHLQRGNWYKTIGSQFTTNKYIKFHMFNDAKKVVYSERITHKGEHHVFKPEHNYQCSSIANPTESLVLVPDEEVAEYINKIINQFPIY
jgi:hypothetical protein